MLFMKFLTMRSSLSDNHITVKILMILGVQKVSMFDKKWLTIIKAPQNKKSPFVDEDCGILLYWKDLQKQLE